MSEKRVRYVVSRSNGDSCIVDLDNGEIARFNGIELHEIQEDADDLNEGRELRGFWRWSWQDDIDLDTLRELHEWKKEKDE